MQEQNIFQYLTHKKDIIPILSQFIESQNKTPEQGVLPKQSDKIYYIIKAIRKNYIQKQNFEFLDLVLQISQIKNIREDCQREIKKLINLIQSEKVESFINQLNPLKVQNQIFNYLNKEQKLKYQKLLIEYLQQEFLQDKSQQQFQPWFSEIVDSQFYKQYLHQSIIKLVNRSDQNIDLLEKVLKRCDFDFTEYFSDYFNLLQDAFVDEKLCDKTISIFCQFLNKCFNKSDQNLQQIQTLITKTFNEKQKIKLIQLLQSFKQGKVTDFILNQSMQIQNDESVQVFQTVLENLPLEASGVQFIKKNIGTNNAKCLSVLLSILLFNKNYELNSLIESTIVDNYFKNPQKIVTNYNAFLNALVLTTQNNDKISDQLFKSELFINKNGFFQKCFQNEIANYLSVQVNINNSKLSEKNQLFQSVIMFQIIKHKSLSLSKLSKILKEDSINLILQVLFIQQFFPEIDDNKSFYLLSYVIKNVNLVSEQNYFTLLYVIYGHKVTRKHQQKLIFKIKEKKETLINHIKCNYQNYLFTLMNENSNKSFAKAFADLECTFLLEQISPILNLENYQIGSTAIQSLDEEFKQNSFLQEKVTCVNQCLLDNQFTTKVLPFTKIEQKKEVTPQPQPTKVKKQTKEVTLTKKDKIEYFDEEQLLNYQKQQSLNLALEYFQKVVNLVQTLVENQKIKEYFQQHIYPHLINLSRIPQTLSGIFQIFTNLFLSYPETSNHAFTLTELIIKMHDFEPQQESNIENLVKFIIKLQTIKNSSFLMMYKHICCYILKNKNFESKIKREVIHSMFNLLQIDMVNNQDDIIECYKIFVTNVNTLGSYQQSENLFMFLVKHIPKEYIVLIFNDLLNLNDKAQQLFLKSLLLPEVAEFPKNFEIYVTLKIIISQTNQLAEQVFQKIQFTPSTIDQNSIRDFDLYKFITNNIKENQELFIQIIKTQFTESYVSDILINKNLLVIRQLFKNDQPEETMLFFPQFLSQVNIDSKFYQQIIETVISQCCSQEHPNLFQHCLEFSLELIKSKGQQHSQTFLDILDPYLEKKLTVQQQIYVLVSMGVLAPFIKDQNKVSQLGTKIINLLKIPDENIQRSISKCIPDLFIFFANPKQLLEENLKSIQSEKNTDIQRGQGYLISGLVKGLGIMSIQEYNFQDIFENTEKKDVQQKFASLYILSALIDNLQKIFEPFFLRYFDHLIVYFSESTEQLRTLAIQTARIGMSNISAYGVSLLLPILLKSLDEKPSWRQKIANLWALGNMAYCSPKTLSSCLPQIVPILSQSLCDTHPKIRSAAHEALTLIGSTIRNPELTLIVDVLIKSIADPFYENKKGLNILLKTEFVHFIDVPALAMIVPIIEYALTSRDQTSKELAAKIVATITFLIKDPKELLPYLKMLIKALKETVCDHLTEVRTIASKAFGSLAKKLSFQYSDQLKECLFGILNSESSTSVERAGAAQALCEVIHNIGMTQFETLLPYILQKAQDPNKSIKEGYIGMFIFFPQIMEEQFEKYISIAVENIMITISDENESLRNLALRVIKVFIQKYGQKQIDLLLKPVLEGVFSVNYLKRASSGLLLEDILKSVNLNKNEIYYQTIVYLYILRHDFVDSIRMQATNTWKVYYIFIQANIENTPKTLKQLLPQLIQAMCDLRSQNIDDINYILKDCIKEFMEKYQEQCLYNIFLIIESYVKQNEEKRSSGFQILTEILQNCEKQYIVKIESNIVDLLSQFMASNSEILRQSIFQTFTALIQKTKNIGCLNQVISPILENINDQTYEHSLKIMQELLLSECQIIIDYLAPQLFTAPLTAFKIDVIMNGASIIGPILYQNQLPLIFDQLFQEDFQMKDQLQYCVNILSVNLDQEDVQNFFLEISEHLEQGHQDVVLDILQYFLKNTNLDFLEYFIDIFEDIVPLIASRDDKTVQKVNEIIETVLNFEDESGQYLQLLISSMHEIEEEFYAFNVENGLNPYLQILQTSLTQGHEDVFENGLELMEIIINQAEEKNLEQYVGKFLGWLIRVLSYKRVEFTKQKIVDLISFFYDFPQAKIYSQQIIYSYIQLLGEKVSQIKKPVVSSLISVMEQTLNQPQTISMILSRILRNPCDNYFYLIYELVKQKISWTQTLQGRIIEVLDDLLKGELIYQNKVLIGKIWGLLMKGNLGIINRLEQLELEIKGSEIEQQNAIYTYLMVTLGVIRKSQDLGPLKKANIQVISYLGKITNVQRQMKVVLVIRKLLNRPELVFLGVNKQTLKTVCEQFVEEDTDQKEKEEEEEVEEDDDDEESD